MSLRAKSCIVCFAMTKSSNYINKNNEHPEVGVIMWHNNIVFDKGDINDVNWLFISENDEIQKLAEKQKMMLKLFDDYIPIVE